jgi:hypothetical protein
MSQKMRCRPSDLLGIEKATTAYYFDRAIWTFGQSVQSEMDEAERKGSKNPKSVPSRQRMILNQWVPPAPGASIVGRFKDPANRG